LLKKGYVVRCLDDLSHGSRDNVAEIASNPEFEFFHIDVCDRSLLEATMKGTSVVYHLAARKIPRYGDAISTLRVNNEGTRNVLELSSKIGCKVIVASTSDVYGKGTPPFKETDDLVLGPSHIRRWSYAVSKIFDEHLALAMYNESHLPIVILRFFGSYGPKNHRSWWGGPQSVFIEQVLRGEQITVHGDGTQTRSFTYIDDLLWGILAAGENDKAVGNIINLGSDQEISICDLAKMISVLIKPDAPHDIQFIPYESFGGGYEDVRRRIPDLSRAREILGFQWHTGLEDGLRKTIEWHKKFIS
jgi:UDP-glucose 4-epimerase